MRLSTLFAAVPVALLLPTLSGCAIGAYFTPISALERAVNGVYEGEGNGITGRVPYRLTLTIQEKTGQASGVLTNLESKKVYTGSGKFRRTMQGADLDMNLFESGNKYRAALHAELKGDHIIGRLRTVLLGQELFPYNINFKKVDMASPADTAPPAAQPVSKP